MSNRSLLQNIYLFKSLTPAELDAVSAISQLQPFGMGDTIFIRGDAATALYLISLGTIKIQQGTQSGDEITLATLSAGSHFGEMAFVDGAPRSATASATDRGELMVIPYEKLRELLHTSPTIAVKFYRDLSMFLCGRLRVTTSDLNYAKEKNVTHF